MSTQFSWVIQWMECNPQEGNYTDVVISAGWQCTGNNGAYIDQIYGTCNFVSPSGSFTPYDELTQEQVLGWVWADGVNKAAVQMKIDENIQQQIQSPIVNLPLPWAQQGV
jgi:hypothetical protein